MVQRPAEAPGLVVVQLRDDLRVLRLVWVGGELHGDRLRNSRRFLAVQVFDRLLRLGSFVVADESHPAGRTWGRQSSW